MSSQILFVPADWLDLFEAASKAEALALSDLRTPCFLCTPAAAVEKLKAAQTVGLAKLDALFASLQHRAFRGEL